MLLSGDSSELSFAPKPFEVESMWDSQLLLGCHPSHVPPRLHAHMHACMYACMQGICNMGVRCNIVY